VTGEAGEMRQHLGAQPEEMRAWSSAAFLSTYLPALIFALGTGVAVPSIPAIARSFHIGFAVASGITTSFLIGNVVAAIPASWLIDRYGRRRVMLGGPVMTALFAFAVVFATTYPELLFLRFADGFFAQLWLMGRITAISQGASPSQRGRQMSWMFGMDNTGKAAGPFLGGVLATTLGIRTPFVAYGILSLVAIIPAYRYMHDPVFDDAQRRRREEMGPIASSTGHQKRRYTYREIFFSRINYFAIAFFAACARGPIQASLMNLYAAFRYNLKPGEIGDLASISALVYLPVGFFAGWAMDRYGRKKTMVPGFTGVGITMVLLAVTAVFHLSVTYYIAFLLLAVFMQGLCGGSIQTIGADVAPPDARAMFLGIWRLTGQGGIALSPVIFASLATGIGYGASFVFTGASGIVVALLVAFKVPETGGRTVVSDVSLTTSSPSGVQRGGSP
jgi:MFS family permease